MMANIVHYSFYLESEPGIPAENLTPTIIFLKKIPGGENLDIAGLSVTNLGDGLYIFSLDWSNYNTLEADGTYPSLFIKIDTGMEILDQKFLTLRVERHDYLPNLVDNIQATADSISSSATSLNQTAETILKIEEGHWIIDNHTLYIYDKSVTAENRSIENASHVFNLYNANGQPASQEVYQRINLN